jgi:hypothetical protein
MQKNIKLQAILEALTSTVFYYRGLNSALYILKNNKFQLGSSLGLGSEEALMQNKTLPYFMSLTRSRVGGYHVNKKSGVLFTLDGDKFNKRFKSKPVAYFDPSQRSSDAEMNEMEDRLYAAEPFINDALSYIKKIDILIGDSAQSLSRIDFSVLSELMRLAKQNSIPIYVYNSRLDWIASNRNKALSIEEVKSFISNNRNKTVKPKTMDRKKVELLDDISIKNFVNSLLFIFNVPPDFRYKDFVAKFPIYREYIKEFKTVSAAISTILGVANTYPYRESIDPLIQLAKKKYGGDVEKMTEDIRRRVDIFR